MSGQAFHTWEPCPHSPDIPAGLLQPCPLPSLLVLSLQYLTPPLSPGAEIALSFILWTPWLHKTGCKNDSKWSKQVAWEQREDDGGSQPGPQGMSRILKGESRWGGAEMSSSDRPGGGSQKGMFGNGEQPEGGRAMGKQANGAGHQGVGLCSTPQDLFDTWW